MEKPKVLIFDIETAPLTAYVWGRKDVNIALNQIKNEWSVIACAAKWLDEKKVYYWDLRKSKNIQDDRWVLTHIWNLLNQADIVITQNGERFDSRKLNARFILAGMPPTEAYRHLDTYKIAKRVADFTSFKLEYLTDKLCTKYKKLDHSEFPGMSLWTECLKGNQKAWRCMEKYNKHDVLSTEELYLKLQQWVPQSMPNPAHKCPRRYAIKCGRKRQVSGLFQIYQCTKCGHKFRGEKI